MADQNGLLIVFVARGLFKMKLHNFYANFLLFGLW